MMNKTLLLLPVLLVAIILLAVGCSNNPNEALSFNEKNVDVVIFEGMEFIDDTVFVYCIYNPDPADSQTIDSIARKKVDVYLYKEHDDSVFLMAANTSPLLGEKITAIARSTEPRPPTQHEEALLLNGNLNYYYFVFLKSGYVRLRIRSEDMQNFIINY